MLNRRNFLIAAAAVPWARAAAPVPEQLDSHLHSGKERDLPMPEWVDLAAQRGRRSLVLLDHLELYRDGEPPRRNYPGGEAGRSAFLADVAAERARRPDLTIYSGWEVFEGELDTGLEMDALRAVDTLGWHISHLKGERPPDGSVLVKRASQILALQKTLPLPMMIFHPFSPRIEGLKRRKVAFDRDTYRYFRGDDQKKLIDLVGGANVYIEMNHSSLRPYWSDPGLREMLIEAIRPLAEAGLRFTVGSDDHSLGHLRDRRYDPAPINEACGVRPEQLAAYWESLRKTSRRI